MVFSDERPKERIVWWWPLWRIWKWKRLWNPTSLDDVPTRVCDLYYLAWTYTGQTMLRAQHSLQPPKFRTHDLFATYCTSSFVEIRSVIFCCFDKFLFQTGLQFWDVAASETTDSLLLERARTPPRASNQNFLWRTFTLILNLVHSINSLM